MPYKCCVPGCRSNKYEGSEYVSVFRFPSDQLIREKWIKAIPRADFVPTKYSCVCLRHFNQSDIVTLLSNKETPTHRQRPKLHPGAVPTLYPETPADFIRHFKQPNAERLDTESGIEDFDLSDLAFRHIMQEQAQSDRISTFEELKTFVEENNVRSDLNWQRVCTDDTVCFYVVNTEDRPYLEVSIKISNDFSVKGWKGNVSIKRSLLKQILGREAKCDQYSKLLNMLGILRSRDSCNELSIIKIENIQSYDDPTLEPYDDSYGPLNGECETIILD